MCPIWSTKMTLKYWKYGTWSLRNSISKQKHCVWEKITLSFSGPFTNYLQMAFLEEALQHRSYTYQKYISFNVDLLDYVALCSLINL